MRATRLIFYMVQAMRRAKLASQVAGLQGFKTKISRSTETINNFCKHIFISVHGPIWALMGRVVPYWPSWAHVPYGPVWPILAFVGPCAIWAHIVYRYSMIGMRKCVSVTFRYYMHMFIVIGFYMCAIVHQCLPLW